MRPDDPYMVIDDCEADLPGPDALEGEGGRIPEDARRIPVACPRLRWRKATAARLRDMLSPGQNVYSEAITQTVTALALALIADCAVQLADDDLTVSHIARLKEEIGR